MKRLKQLPTIVPFRMGKLEIAGQEFTNADGNCGRVLLSQILTDDDELSERIRNSPMLMQLRELVLTQTDYSISQKTGGRLVPNSTRFFGGSVYSFDKTTEGFFLCTFRDTNVSGDGEPCPSDRIGGVLILSTEGITESGLKLLEAAGLLTDDEEDEEDGDVAQETKAPPASLEEFTPEREMKDAEVLASVSAIMNAKLAGKTKKESNPL